MSAEDRVQYWKRRCAIAEQNLDFEKKHNEHTINWAREAFEEQRRLTDRLVHVIRLAAEHGVPIETFNA